MVKCALSVFRIKFARGDHHVWVHGCTLPYRGIPAHAAALPEYLARRALLQRERVQQSAAPLQFQLNVRLKKTTPATPALYHSQPPAWLAIVTMLGRGAVPIRHPNPAPHARYCLKRGATRQDSVLVIFGTHGTPPVRHVVETARWFPSARGDARLGMHAQFTGCERTARGAPILHQNRADAATSCAWYGVGMWKRAKRAAVANVATKAPAAALGWGGRSTGCWGGTAGTPRGALRSAVEFAPALARHPVVPQCSVGHVRPAAGEMGEGCSRECWYATAAGYRSSALHRDARHLQRTHCARALTRGHKAPVARIEAAAHCGNPGTGVPRARSSPRGSQARCWRGGGQAHRGSGTSLPFATTEHVPQKQFDAHHRRGHCQTSPSAIAGEHGSPRPS